MTEIPFIIFISKPILILSILLLFLIYLRIRLFKLKIHFLNSGHFNGHLKYRDLSAVIHFHTTYSDGSGDIKDIIKIALRIKTDVLISSDHNTLKPKYDGIEGYYGNMLYFAGEEINTEFGHLLALGINDEIKRGNYKRVLSDIKKQSGFPVICHPHNWWTPWKNFSVKGYGGIEIINLDSQWRGMNPFYIFVVFATYKINPFYAMHFLAHKPNKTILFWDSVQKHGHMKIGIASSDAHSNVKITKKRRIKMPKYEELFRVARTHVLLDEKNLKTATTSAETFEVAKKSVIEAIKSGKCYFSFDMFGAPEGFYFELSCEDKFYGSGDILNFRNQKDNIDIGGKNMVIYSGIKINHRKNPFVINLFANGKKIYGSKNKDLKLELSYSELMERQSYSVSGAEKIGKIGSEKNSARPIFLRVEIDVSFGHKKLTYLYSNNIEVF